MVYKDLVLVGGSNALRAFDKSGRLHWQQITNAKITGLTISDNRILNTRTGRGLFSNNIENGNEEWSIQPNYQMLSMPEPTLIDSILIIGNFDYKEGQGSHLACINTYQQNTEWSIPNNGYFNSKAVVNNESIFFNSDSSYKKGTTYKINLKTGELIWKSKTNPETFLPPLIKENKLFINSYTDGIICLNTDNGEVNWNTQNRELVSNTKFLYYKETLLFGTQNRELLGLNKQGQVVFKSQFYYGIGNPFIYNDNIYVNDGNGSMYRVNYGVNTKY